MTTDQKVKLVGLGILIIIVLGAVGIFLITSLFRAWRRAEHREVAFHRDKTRGGRSKISRDIWQESGKRLTGDERAAPETEPGSSPLKDDEPDGFDDDDEPDDAFDRR